MAEALAGDANARVRWDAKAFRAILKIEKKEVAGEALVDGGVVNESFREAGKEVSG